VAAGDWAGFPPRREATPGMGTNRAAGAAHGDGRERGPGARAPTGASAEAEMAGAGTLWECGDGCENRRTQRGVTVQLRVLHQLKKGRGLHAAQALHRAQFVCEYAGIGCGIIVRIVDR
jgi:histone-lysine N-methyltransferase SETMAR